MDVPTVNLVAVTFFTRPHRVPAVPRLDPASTSARQRRKMSEVHPVIMRGVDHPALDRALRQRHETTEDDDDQASGKTEAEQREPGGLNPRGSRVVRRGSRFLHHVVPLAVTGCLVKPSRIPGGPLRSASEQPNNRVARMYANRRDES